MTVWRQLWTRVPEGARVLLILAAIVDLVGLPSLLDRLVAHQRGWPWTAWAWILGSPHAGHLYGTVAVGLLAAAAVLGWRWSDGGSGARPAGDALGSARWRAPGDLARTLGRWRAGAASNPAGLVVGAGEARGPVKTAWVQGPEHHGLVLGAPGAGKTLRVILPTIAVVAEAGENLVITDPKGELQRLSRGVLAAAGYTVVVLDLRDPRQSVAWNPLDLMQAALAAGDEAGAVRLAQDLAQVVAQQGAPGGGEDAFWVQSARAIVAALSLYVADQAPPPARHLATAYHLVTEGAPYLDAWMQALPSMHPARLIWGPLLTSAPETRQNQLSVAAVSLSLFADPNIRVLTGRSGFRAAQLTRPRTAVFLVVPDDRSTYYPIAALFVSQLLQALAQMAAQAETGRLPVPVHFVLDEFGNLPKIPDFEKALTVGRGRGIQVILALQALAQLDHVYGPKLAETMRNACNTWVYLSANDPETARLVSEAIGQTTIETESRGHSWQSGAQPGWSTSTQITARALVTPDEVRRWQPTEALVLQQGRLPARLPARLWPDWPAARRAAEAAPPPEGRPAGAGEAPTLWLPDPPPPPLNPQGAFGPGSLAP